LCHCPTLPGAKEEKHTDKHTNTHKTEKHTDKHTNTHKTDRQTQTDRHTNTQREGEKRRETAPSNAVDPQFCARLVHDGTSPVLASSMTAPAYRRRRQATPKDTKTKAERDVLVVHV